MDREEKQGLKLLFIGIVVVALALIVSMLLFESIRPTFLRLEREAIQESQGFNAAKIQQVDNLITQWSSQAVKISELDSATQADQITALQGSQKALLNQIHTVSAQIADGEMPEHIQTFLDENPRGGGQ